MPRSILLRLTDMREAIQGITALIANVAYDFVPQGWFFLTDKIGFAELYNFSLDIRRRGFSSTCMGGRVPLLSFSPSSGLYEALKEYLSYLSGDIFKDNGVAQGDRTQFFKIKEADNSISTKKSRVSREISEKT